MQPVHRTLFRIARVCLAHSRWIRLHGANFLLYGVWRFAQRNIVVVRLRHLLAVQPRHFRLLGEQRLWFGQNNTAIAFEVTKQTLGITNGQILLLRQQGACAL
jgi:hypothetical protein